MTTEEALAKRRRYRAGLFHRRGMTPEKAEELAYRLEDRDADLDDRRMCIECAHRAQDRTCFAAKQGWLPGASRRGDIVMDLILHRCLKFKWQTPT